MITMIYDSDSAGQRAMKRGINIALREGMDVQLLELPEGEDPDSFIRQFGTDSLRELHREASEDFLSYLVHKAKDEGHWARPARKTTVVNEILRSIAHMPDPVSRETYVQHLNKKAKVGGRGLFDEPGKWRQEMKEGEQYAPNRRQRRKERRRTTSGGSRPRQPAGTRKKTVSRPEKEEQTLPRKRPNYEKELIRLMLLYGRDMIDFIGTHCVAKHFEDPQLRLFYEDIIERFKEEQEVSVEEYADREHPYPELVGEIVLEKYSVSDRHHEMTGIQYKRDKNPYRTAKGALKALTSHFIDRLLQDELPKRYRQAEGEERKKVIKLMKEVGLRRSRLQQSSIDELYPDPDTESAKSVSEKVFRYEMKSDR